MRGILVGFCITLLAIPGADARSKRPAPGSVSCSCRCIIQKDGGWYSDLKFVGGYGQWDKSRAQCQAFNGSRCESEVDGEIHESKLSGCDTIVHSLPTDRTRTAPPASEMAPEDQSSGGGAPAGNMNRRFKLQRKTD